MAAMLNCALLFKSGGVLNIVRQEKLRHTSTKLQYDLLLTLLS